MQILAVRRKSQTCWPASNLGDCAGTLLDIDTIYSWSVENKLPLCLKKCQCLHVGASNIQHIFTIDGFAVQAVVELTDLSITHSTTNSYDMHISNIVRKAPLASSGGHSQLAKRHSI
jgi:hypothetical protein